MAPVQESPWCMSRLPTILGVATGFLVVIIIPCVLRSKKKTPFTLENPGEKSGPWEGCTNCICGVPCISLCTDKSGVKSLCNRSWKLGICEGNGIHAVAWWVVGAKPGDDFDGVMGGDEQGIQVGKAGERTKVGVLSFLSERQNLVLEQLKE